MYNDKYSECPLAVVNDPLISKIEVGVQAT